MTLLALLRTAHSATFFTPQKSELLFLFTIVNIVLEALAYVALKILGLKLVLGSLFPATGIRTLF